MRDAYDNVNTATPTTPTVVAEHAQRRWRLDRFEFLVLAAFAAFSVWVLGLDLWQVVAHGRVWTGTDGFYLVDQMQYLAWINDASRHGLASNLFVLRPTPADYFQPVITVSGAITALGVAPWLSYLVWKPVAVGAAFFAVRAYAYRSFTERSARRATLVLALFFGSFTVIYGSVSIVGDLLPGFLSWGYPFGLLALAAMLIALLAYDRSRRADRLSWAPALLGALASSLHPWQGETLILIVIAVELLTWREAERVQRRIAMASRTVIGTAIPLLYYAILGRTDLSWRLARVASHHSFSLTTIALALAPLLLPALVAYRVRPTGFISTATRVWPIAALSVFLLSGTQLSATPLHAFVGITVPLAVLAVEGVRAVGWNWIPRPRLVAALAIALVTIPAAEYELRNAELLTAPSAGNANFIAHDERRALQYLARDPDPGGVVTRFYLGTVVPAETRRRTFVGDCLWSEPGCTPRAQITERLFDGSLTAHAARVFVLLTGAHFVLSDCEARTDLQEALAPITSSVHRFGCASVYVVARTVAIPPAEQAAYDSDP